MKLEFDTIEEVIDFAARVSGEEGETKTTRTRAPRKAKDTAANGGAEAPDPAGIPNGGNSPSLVPSDGAQGGNGPQITTMAGGPAFTPPGAGAFPGGAAMGATVGAAPVVDPAVAGFVSRISTRIQQAVDSGQPTAQMLEWFRTQCGVQFAQATLDQIKQAALPQLPVAKLEEITKLMNA